MRVTAIVNQKGGCGKTTTAINLASVLASGGARTLLVDLDPQSHCSLGLGIPESRVEVAMSHALSAPDDIDPESLLWEVARNLKLAPSTIELAAFEATSHGAERDRRLERLLARLASDFDWCILDCPPTVGLLTFNALRACDETIVPVETGYFALRGAERQVATVQAVAARLGREVTLRLLPSMHRDGAKVSQEVLAALERRFAEIVVPVVVREHEVLREAASFGQAIPEFAPQSAAHEDFRRLAEWLRANPPAPRPVHQERLEAGSLWAEPEAPAPQAGRSDRAAELVARMRSPATAPEPPPLVEGAS
ncbi:MAG: ParA family protein [Phycisphaeraceae bacterium]|nr:ParA family protein [Phycisphaeraceae bacterium]